VFVLNTASDPQLTGPWLAHSGAWTRPADFTDGLRIPPNIIFPISEGTTYADTRWALITDGEIVVGVTPLSWGAAFVAGAVVDADFAATRGILHKDSEGTYRAIKSNLSAIVPPTNTDDNKSKAYVIGSLWIDTVGDKVYHCVDASDNAAVWLDVSAATPLADLGEGTLEDLNAAINNAILDDSSNPRPPTAHAEEHVTGGADVIQDATGAQDGLMTFEYAAKLDGISEGADVTQEANVLAALSASDNAKDMGGGAISNVDTVDGRDVSADGGNLDNHLSGEDPNPHGTRIGTLAQGSTLADLNDKLTDATLVAPVPAVRQLYVGKHGSDANAGTTHDTALLTFAAAITAASALTPTANARVAIVCADAGLYSEVLLVVPSYVDIRAPSAQIVNAGAHNTIQVGASCRVDVWSLRNDGTGPAAVVGANDSGLRTVIARRIVADLASVAVINYAIGPGVDGELHVHAEDVEVDTGSGVIDASTNGHLYVDIAHIHLKGNGASGIKSGATSAIQGYVSEIVIEGSPTGTIALNCDGGTVNVAVNVISTAVAWDVEAGATLNLVVGSTSGTELNDGTANVLRASSSDHGNLSGLADDDHPQYLLKTQKAAANGVASLDANSRLIQSARIIRVTDADLTAAGVADGEFLKRSGTTIVGGTPAGGAADWQVDTTGTLSNYLREFWRFNHAPEGGSVLAEPGVLGNWATRHNAINPGIGNNNPLLWSRLHPTGAGGRRGSVDFNTSNRNYIIAPGRRPDLLPFGSKPFWFSIWFYPRATGFQYILSCTNYGSTRPFEFAIYNNNIDLFMSTAQGNRQITTVPPTVNVWNHACFGLAGGSVFLCLNGGTPLYSSAATSITLSDPGVWPEFGGGVPTLSQYYPYNGLIADVGMWVDDAASPTMVAPTAQQFADLYNGGNGNSFRA